MRNRESIKKIIKVRKALYLTSNFVVMLVMVAFAALMAGLSVYYTLIPKEWKGGQYIFIFNMLFMSLAIYALLSVMSSQPSERMRVYVKGNQLLINELKIFPITKRDCIRASFGSWAKAVLIPIATFLVLNISVLVSDSFTERKGYIGFSTLLSIVILFLVEYYLIICSCNKKRHNTAISLIFVALYLGLFAFSTFFSEADAVINFYDYFAPIAGILGIIITAALIPLAYVLTDILLLNNKKTEAWNNE